MAFPPAARAAEWQLDQPAWSGRMRITARGSVAFIKLEDKNSGKEPTEAARGGVVGCGALRWTLPEPACLPGHSFPPPPGELFAQAAVDQFPGIAVESVTDSSRYFVLRIEDGNGTDGMVWVLPSWGARGGILSLLF